MTYDVMKDVMVKAGIRDGAARDLAAAMADIANIANWVSFAAEHEMPDDVACIQEYAAMKLRHYREQMKRL
jgi:hypothetical protein